jgi:hypothetical protein
MWKKTIAIKSQLINMESTKYLGAPSLSVQHLQAAPYF